jgi:hypothetical protein
LTVATSNPARRSDSLATVLTPGSSSTTRTRAPAALAAGDADGIATRAAGALDGIEFWRIGWQLDKCHVLWHFQMFGAMEAGPVPHHDRMLIGGECS